jgi:hypothetical protein
MPMHSASPTAAQPNEGCWHRLFAASVLPRLLSHAAVCLRGVRCPHERAELRAEMCALGWLWFVRLVHRGQVPERFPTVLAAYAGRAAKSGRRLCGQLPAKDVLSPLAQRRHRFAVRSLPGGSSLDRDALGEALHDNSRSEVPDQVAFRCDFPAWHATLSGREQVLVNELLLGEPAGAAAAHLGVSPGRVSQQRRELGDDWRRFTGEADRHPQRQRPGYA